jgi:predicted kinase
MSTLYLICGLPGTGKTTLAKKIEIDCKALRLCPDEWISIVIKDKNDKRELDRLREPVERLMWDLAKKLLFSGVNVILENGFWSREERLDYLRSAKEVDVDVKVTLHYLDVPIEDLWHRIRKRNLELPENCFHITREELNQWMSWFTPPNQDEFKLYDGYEVHGVC